MRTWLGDNLFGSAVVWIDYANALNDLGSPPGNRLEALRGDGPGPHELSLGLAPCFLIR